jgi:general secretion pathway protein E/type IV pilus assembly protein PilB
MLSGNIIGIVAQRLIRKVCMHCREAAPATDFERKLMRQPEDSDITLYQARGCDECNHTGYRGRLSVMELLKMDDDLDELVARRATRRELHNMAISKGFKPLSEDGVRRVLEGVTTLDEISRVIDLTDRLV